MIWLVEWQLHFAYGRKWISSCNFCVYWVICTKFTEDLHVMLLSSFTFYETLVHWEPFISQNCKCNSVLVFYIFLPIWIKCYIENMHVTLLSSCEFCENWWCERHALFMVGNEILAGFCTFLLMWITFGVGNMDKIGLSSCELYWNWCSKSCTFWGT